MLIREIETFLAVVAAGSINKATRLLNITQSSVSQRLKKLEEDVGSVLIDRRKGGWLTTITLPLERQLHFPVGSSRKKRRE